MSKRIEKQVLSDYLSITITFQSSLTAASEDSRACVVPCRRQRKIHERGHAFEAEIAFLSVRVKLFSESKLKVDTGIYSLSLAFSRILTRLVEAL